MLNFDADRFLRIQSGAVDLAHPIQAIVAEALGRGARNVHFLGTGGAAILMQPAARLVRLHSTFPVFSDWTAELLVEGSANLGADSLVVIPSLSGTTKESVALLDYARSRGATVLALVGHEGTPLATGDHHVLVNFAADDTSSESFILQSLLVALAIMAHRGEGSGAAAMIEEIRGLPHQLLGMKKAFEPRARAFAERIAAKDFHVFTGAGFAWPEAHYFGMCILEEMQWIRTRPVHASDFFHGALELVESGVSVVLLKGEDPSRALAERVEQFVPTVGGELLVLDTADYPTEGISAELRSILAPVFLATLLERAAAHLEVLRDHPLTTRRYYRRVAY